MWGKSAIRITTIYVGNLYEKNLSTGEETKYYYAEGRRIAMRKTQAGGGSQVYYLLTDHLGGTVSVVNPDGTSPRNSTYYSFGAQRLNAANALTDKLYTGQQLENSTGLYYYGARFYDPIIGRFISPDTLVPDPMNPQALNRYSYAYNNPVRFNDPSGHAVPISNPWSGKKIDISSWPDAAKSLAVGGCFLVGCHVDTEQGIITGPPDREYAEGVAYSIAGPMGEISGPAASAEGRFFTKVLQRIKSTSWSTERIQGFLDNVPKYLGNGRFGRALYLAEEGDTAVAEVTAHGGQPAYAVRAKVKFDPSKLLDLTKPEIAEEYNYVGDSSFDYAKNKDLVSRAKAKGYNAIKYESVRANGTNYALLDDFPFNDSLEITGITPVAE